MNFFPPNTILDEEIFTPRNLCPDYVVSHIWEAFILHIRSGALVGEPLAELESGLKQIEYRTIRSLPELWHSVYDSVLGLEEYKDVSGAVRKSQSRFSEMTCPPAGAQMGVKWGSHGDVLAGFCIVTCPDRVSKERFGSALDEVLARSRIYWIGTGLVPLN